MRNLFIIMLSIGISLLACVKSEPIIDDNPDPPPVTIPKDVLDTLWTLRLFEHEDFSLSNNLYFYENELYTTATINARGFDNYIAKIDVYKGELVWEKSAHGLDNVSSHIYNDRLILKDWQKYAAFSLETGKILEKYSYGKGGDPRAFFVDNKMYMSDEPNGRGGVVDLYMVNDVTNLYRKGIIYTLEKEVFPDATRSIESVNGYIDPETGHDMIVFQHRMTSLIKNYGRIDFVFYDVTDRKVTKIHKDIEPNGNSSVAQILIVEDKAYFQGSNTIYCFDLNTQEMVWHQRYLGEKFDGFMFTQLVYADDLNLILAKGDAATLYAFHPDTGEEVWVNKDAGHNGVPITYYDGHVYYIVNSKLRIHNAQTGEFVTEKRTPLDSREYFATDSNVVIDPERKLMFVTSRNVIFCSELLPKRE